MDDDRPNRGKLLDMSQRLKDRKEAREAGLSPRRIQELEQTRRAFEGCFRKAGDKHTDRYSLLELHNIETDADGIVQSVMDDMAVCIIGELIEHGGQVEIATLELKAALKKLDRSKPMPDQVDDLVHSNSFHNAISLFIRSLTDSNVVLDTDSLKGLEHKDIVVNALLLMITEIDEKNVVFTTEHRDFTYSSDYIPKIEQLLEILKS